MKHCGKCDRDKSLKEFSRRGYLKDGSIKYQPWCKSCQKIYKDKHYIDNISLYRNKVKLYKVNAYQWLTEYKSNKPCVDCKNTYPYYVMDFDHLPGSIKMSHNGMRTFARDHSKEKTLEEISKCDLLCSNCHRIRTYTRAHLAP